MNNPLWGFSLELYARPEVAAACIEAQDHCAADVNLLLYAAWLARQGFELDQNQWQALVVSVADWRQRVVQPLRDLRRDWQALPAAADLRERVKVLELAAEREQQAQIFIWHQQQVLRSAREDSLALALAQLLPSPSMREGGGRRALVRRLLALLA